VGYEKFAVSSFKVITDHVDLSFFTFETLFKVILCHVLFTIYKQVVIYRKPGRDRAMVSIGR